MNTEPGDGREPITDALVRAACGTCFRWPSITVDASSIGCSASMIAAPRGFLDTARRSQVENAGMLHRITWDGLEPITDAMERCGVGDEFQAATDREDRTAAIRILCDVGADAVTAQEIVAMVIADEKT